MASDERPETLERATLYESEWINVYGYRVRLPTGRILSRYHVIDFPRQATMAVVTNDAGDYLMVRLHRYPIDEFSWEFPAGRVEDGESVLDAARREALEETGYETTEHRHLYTYHPSPGISNQTFNVVACRAGRQVREPDEHEIGGVKWMSAEEIRAMIARRELTDGYTLTAFLLAESGT